jgi:hypothetical protein
VIAPPSPAPIPRWRVNPIAARRDESSGHRSSEGAMIMQSLAVAFILTFGAIAIFGHLLLVRAVFTPTKAAGAATADARSSHRAELARLRITL